MFDYVEDYAKKYAAESATQFFWRHVYRLMMSKGCPETEALNLLDPEGKDRIKYPRPTDFPDCFAESY